MGNHLYLADFDDSGKIVHVGSHLACFYGGNWLLGVYACYFDGANILTSHLASYKQADGF